MSEFYDGLRQIAAPAGDDARRIEPDETLDALGYLQAVYRGRIAGEAPRMRAAIAALPFERPKLAVVANITSFASQMEALARAAGRGNVIDAPFQNLDVVEEID